MWQGGKVYSLDLTVQKQESIDEKLVKEQLKRLGYKESQPKTEKKIITTTYIWRDRQHKLPDRTIVVRSIKKAVLSISFD
ncbi:MAG: hypothetical protein ACXVPQ_12450 [Bacteroidia bacterium]